MWAHRYGECRLIQDDISEEDLERFLVLCNSLQLVTLVLSLDMFITHANSLAALLFLHPEQQLIDRNLHNICHELGIEVPIPPSFTQNSTSISATTEHWLSDKKLVTVHWSMSCCIEETICTRYILVGKIIMTCFADKPLLHMAKILHALPCAIFSKDTSSFCLSANTYQAEIAGVSRVKDMIGKSDYDMPWCDVAETIRKADQLVMTENKTFILEEYGTVANGKKSAFLVSKSPFRDENGKLLGIVGTAVNIGHHRQTLFLDTMKPVGNSSIDISNVYLTKKEIECIRWMIHGKSSTEIATLSHVSKRTVETHMNNIKRKLNCHKQFQVGYLIGKYSYLLS